jgi:hypothetical protein
MDHTETSSLAQAWAEEKAARRNITNLGFFNEILMAIVITREKLAEREK